MARFFEPKEILHSLGETFHPEDSDGVALEAVLAIKGPSGLGRMRGMFAGRSLQLHRRQRHPRAGHVGS